MVVVLAALPLTPHRVVALAGGGALAMTLPAENQQTVEAALDLLRYSNAQPNLGAAWKAKAARAALRDLAAQADRNDGLVLAATEVTEVAMYIGECGDHPEHLMAAEHAVQRLAAALARLDGAR